MVEPRFECITEGIYRLCIPFERIYTTVFALIEGKRAILIDCGSSDADVDSYILPAIRSVKWEIVGVFCSHSHEDHAGGILRMGVHFPNSILYPAEGEILLDRFHILALPGHSSDCIGVWEPETRTLITCDAVQQSSIDRFPILVSDPIAYGKTLERIRALSPQRLLCSHDYIPFGWCVAGENVETCLAFSEKVVFAL